MSLEKHRGVWVIVLSFVFAFMLAIMPLPAWANPWRPNWVAMTLLYWCIALPQRVGVLSGWTVGIVFDILRDTLFGLHALSFSVLAYLGLKFHRRIRVLPYRQQMPWVFALMLMMQSWEVWMRGMQGAPADLSFIYPAISSTLLWHWLFILLRDVRRTYRVS
ncbi:MAG: rod shape-determining protein MreD [Gammaproteobacteria bacterium]|nr:rod shape-determining protein MreD [Gammaproteobacteria bacterium]